MVEKKELRRLMEQYGMLADVEDFDTNDYEVSNFTRDALYLISEDDRECLTQRAAELTPCEHFNSVVVNILDLGYSQKVRMNLMQLVLDALESDMNDLINEAHQDQLIDLSCQAAGV